jgi:hypothetical protein
MIQFFNTAIALKDRRSQQHSLLHGIQSADFSFNQEVFNIADVGRMAQRSVYVPHTGTINITRVFSQLYSDPYLLVGPFLAHLFAFNGIYGPDGPNSYKHSLLLHRENLGYSITGNTAFDIRSFDFYINYPKEDENFFTSTRILELNNCLLTSIKYSFTPTDAPTETLSFSYNGRNFGDSVSFNKDIITMGENPSKQLLLLKGRDFNYNLSKLPQPIDSLLHNYKSTLVHGITGIDVSCDINHISQKDVGVWNGSSETSPNLWKSTSLPLTVNTSIKYTTENKIFDELANVKNTDNIYDFDQIRYVFKTNLYNNFDLPLYFVLNIGKKNKLTSISRSSVDTSGGLEEITCEYSNVNNDFATYFTDSTNFEQAEQRDEKI